MRSLFLSAGLLALMAAPAMAQPATVAPHPGPGKVVTGPPGLPSVEPLVHHPTNLSTQSARSEISPALPEPELGPNASATANLRAAQSALESRRLGLAQSALERAQTALLNDSQMPGATGQTEQSPAVQNVSEALQALGRHDVATAMDLVQQTIPMSQQMSAEATPPPPPPGSTPSSIR